MAGETSAWYRVEKVKGRYYLVKEWWDPVLGKKVARGIGNCELIEGIVAKFAKRGAGAGIRTRAGLRQRSLSPPPLT